MAESVCDVGLTLVNQISYKEYVRFTIVTETYRILVARK